MSNSLRETLWANLLTLMTQRWGRENLTRLGKESGTGPATPSRLKVYQQAVGIDVLERLAAPFGVQAWQLLSPTLGRAFSLPATEIAQMFDALEPARQEQAYALIVQMLAFGNSGALQPASRPTSLLAPVPQTPPEERRVSPAPRRIPER